MQSHLETVVTSWPRLRLLNLSECVTLKASQLIGIAQRLPGLTHLAVCGSAVDDA